MNFDEFSEAQDRGANPLFRNVLNSARPRMNNSSLRLMENLRRFVNFAFPSRECFAKKALSLVSTWFKKEIGWINQVSGGIRTNEKSS